MRGTNDFHLPLAVSILLMISCLLPVMPLLIACRESPCCIVMEVMNEGSLKSYLQDCSDEGISVPLVVKLWVMFQVAVAMNYISVKKG